MKIRLTLTTEAAAIIKKMYESGELAAIGVTELTEEKGTQSASSEPEGMRINVPAKAKQRACEIRVVDTGCGTMPPFPPKAIWTVARTEFGLTITCIATDHYTQVQMHRICKLQSGGACSISLAAEGDHMLVCEWFLIGGDLDVLAIDGGVLLTWTGIGSIVDQQSITQLYDNVSAALQSGQRLCIALNGIAICSNVKHPWDVDSGCN